MTDISSPASTLVERRTASIARYKATGYDVGIEPARDGGWVSYGDFLAYASEAASRLTAMRAELEAARKVIEGVAEELNEFPAQWTKIGLVKVIQIYQRAARAFLTNKEPS
jgi:hypothetical protein